jgi:Flp pilus assembly protein TadD
MIRRWLRRCLLPSALCLGAVGCTPSVESLTGGLVTGPTPAVNDRPVPVPSRGSDELPADMQLRLHLDTAKQLDAAGNDEGALAEYEGILQLDRANYTAMRRLCVLYDRRGDRDDFKKAEELYRKVAGVRPNDPDVWCDWGYSLFLRTDKETCRENWAEAERKLRQALKLNPQHARAHANLGLVLGQLDRFDEAYREFRAAQLSDAEAHCDMAFVYWQRGRMEDAKQECRIAHEKDPALAKAKDMLAALEHPPQSREKGGSAKSRGALTADREAAEHEAARRFVSGMSGGTSAGAPVPAGGTPTWQSASPITMPSGARWVPVQPGTSSVPGAPVPAPAPAPVGNAGTISFE